MSLLGQLNLTVRNRSELGEATFTRLRGLIYDRTGIYFQDNKRYLLESRIGKRLTTLGLPDYDAYLAYVQNGGMQRELPQLFNAITINETFFFRHTPQIDALEEEILPELIRQKERDGNRLVRIWSAACSTGDEPYTLALLIRERLQPRYPRTRFEIVGTDLNTEVLDTARAGVYGPYAVRTTPPVYLNRYFRRQGDQYELLPEIRDMVRFKQLNLMDRAGMQAMRNFDVILCANVLIYFDTESKQQVVSALYNSLNPGGHLLIGFSETLYGVTQALQPVRFAKTIAYRKG